MIQKMDKRTYNVRFGREQPIGKKMFIPDHLERVRIKPGISPFGKIHLIF